MDITQVQAVVAQVARAAGETALQYFARPIQQAHKLNSKDIVTEADQAVEALILRELRACYPDHHFVGEESGSSGASPEDAPYRWYIDPIDGTTNFANGIPYFSISIALTDRENVPLVGAVCSPVWGELFTAARGQGAMLNGAPIRVSDADQLDDCVLVSGFPYSREDNPNIAQWAHFLPLTRDLRRMGSAALDLCWVAAGRFDGYWEMRLRPWDIMAGALIVQEAGGMVSDYSGDPSGAFRRLRPHVVASNGRIHQQMLDGLKATNALNAVG